MSARAGRRGSRLVQTLGIVLVVAAGGSQAAQAISSPGTMQDGPGPATVEARIDRTIATMPSRGTVTATARPATLEQLVGQKLVVRMAGLTPSTDLLGRIRRGEVGGVILFGSNVSTRAALVALTAQLRAAATAGGQPPLLIAVDQEGGSIKRIPWAPPTLSPPQIGATGSASIARSQGARTGSALRALGINVDLAPVADVPASTATFMYRQGRTFSFSATRTAALADAFASGLEASGVVPSMKHFPGIGITRYDTDTHVVRILASQSRLARDLAPYRTAIAHRIPLIMLSNAIYTAYDRINAAGWSPAIGGTLLRRDLGFTGATITDALDGAASARGVPTWRLALGAARAGTDMILLTGSEASTRVVYEELLAHARSGLIPPATLRASYRRIVALKSGL
jgi:beta-N-acetylhexosaminidase